MLTVMTKTQIRALPIFSGLPDDALNLLDDTMWRRYAAGEVLVPVGETQTNIFVLLTGRVVVELDGIRIASRGPNEIVGEQSFIDEKPHSALVRVTEMATALRLPPQTVRDLKRYPAFVDALLKILSGKLREATSDRWERYAEHERLFAEFAAHVGPEVRDALLRGVRTGTDYGAPRHADVALLSSDLRGFTSATQNVEDPNDVAAALTAYLDDMVEIIHRHGGWVDKYVGDAILAVWHIPGLPVVGADAPLRAAIEMIQASPNHQLGGLPLRTGVGLNYGRVFMGNVGSLRKRQFTVIGAPVNLAARYEQKSKTLGAIVCGPDYYATLDDATKASLEPTAPQEIAGIVGSTVLYVYSENI
jgi:class 3 adenylate cyclase